MLDAATTATDTPPPEPAEVTFYRCPPCNGGYWSPSGPAVLYAAAPRDRINGGARLCPACNGAAYDDEAARADAKADATY